MEPPTSQNMASRIMTRAKSFKRQSTSNSAFETGSSQTSKRSESFKVQAEREAAQPKTKRYQERVPAYGGLTWEQLHDFLLQKWPNVQFKLERRSDSWVFETPEPLTTDDRRAIAKMRDSNMAKSSGRRRSVTPE
ncbi:hypothetical protein F4805DRAFT_377229 [Annulohypoxylon moriforme]|nr:hypothetical protein F4805DRAFT_377229 [Annulohypoxylon moriforme]